MTVGGRKVTVFAKSTSVSTTPVRPGKTYPLSPLDHAMASHTIHLVFYYGAGPTIERTGLKESLSEVLSNYPAMTGRLGRALEDGNWVVRCNDAGVRVLDARVGMTLERWLASATAEEEMELVYWEPMGEDPSVWSPFYVQITEFEDKGYAIGISCSHMHADPTSVILFVKAWGDSHRRACIINPPFFHPPALRSRPSPNLSTPSAHLLSLKSINPTAAASSSMSSASFCFSQSAIKSLLHDAPDASPFSALAALFWSSIARAKGQHGTCSLVLCTDFRKRLHAPLPHGFYGNALHLSAVVADVDAGVAPVAAIVKELMEGMEEEQYWSAIELVESRKTEGGGYGPAFPMYGPELTCLNLEHVFAYAAVFEKGEAGRPAHVSCRVGGVHGEGLVVVMPGQEEGTGRTVAVTLPEDLTERICEDEEILKYGTMLMFT